MSSSSATLTAPAATPHLRAVRSVSAAPAAADRWHQAPAAPAPLPPALLPPTLLPLGHAQLTGQPAIATELLGAFPEGAAVVAALPQSALPQGLLAQYGAQLGAAGAAAQSLVGYLVLVPADSAAVAAAPVQALPVPVAPVHVTASAPNSVSERATARAGQRGISVDLDRRSAYVDGKLLDLTYLEFELLAHLTQYPQRVHTRDHLVSAVWGYGHVGDGRTVDVHVARLRRKLGVGHRDSIVTVRRVGYKYAPISRG
ncbi:winged helix-turn-helix domain-containing protein [Kitasatospora sp. NBC_01287]|uniref:winged helix-turn-helix domain-containing protein n=1 Tax=Kitasatospora sp. NBC_01287 TaxID=2903573 RepID=UPI002256734F|nr:winged helix-turn-helix domain-containing protein [Kitasatospora sp. NBC_01287]MCX4745348.1 winged helix-turn-helix domain-containing protein [Kitasatospora sp. NBC_01287]